MLKRIRNIIYLIRETFSNSEQIISFLQNDIKNPKVTTGRLLANFNNQLKDVKSLSEVEFQVFSQWGDDGIIQYLISKLDIPNKTFIEFGVENYRESNTRFLLINNNWSGLVLDGSEENINYITKDIISWGYNLIAKKAFITKENINDLIAESSFDKEVGLLSIDIDGNDYWIWKAIDVINPIIVISEYNSIFGENQPWTLPYKADFVRPYSNKNPLHCYYGSSLLSLCDLAEEKGYYFIGCNSAGNNAYFIRKDKIANLKPLKAKDGFVESKFRECFNTQGKRVVSVMMKKELAGQSVFNTRNNCIENFG